MRVLIFFTIVAIHSFGLTVMESIFDSNSYGPFMIVINILILSIVHFVFLPIEFYFRKSKGLIRFTYSYLIMLSITLLLVCNNYQRLPNIEEGVFIFVSSLLFPLSLLMKYKIERHKDDDKPSKAGPLKSKNKRERLKRYPASPQQRARK